jgi:hypothetical protein
VIRGVLLIVASQQADLENLYVRPARQYSIAFAGSPACATDSTNVGTKTWLAISLLWLLRWIRSFFSSFYI